MTTILTPEQIAEITRQEKEWAKKLPAQTFAALIGSHETLRELCGKLEATTSALAVELSGKCGYPLSPTIHGVLSDVRAALGLK
jgi:hypothetical protein